MNGTIKKRLICGFLSIVAIFGIGGLVIMSMIQEAGRESKQFLSEYWPTADLIMETRIAFDALSRKVLHPPAGAEAPEFVRAAQDEMRSFQARFRDTELSAQDKQKVDELLEKVVLTIPKPVALDRLPGLKMEEADAAAGPVLEELRRLGQVELVNSLWEAVMAFNDILITGDPREREHFAEQVAAIEAHPQFPRIEMSYRLFKVKALEVFAVAEQLGDARENFIQAGETLAVALRELEGRYEETVVNSAAAEILNGLKTSVMVLWSTAIISALLSLLIAFRTALGISRPVRQVMEVLKRMERGHLDNPLRLRRNDEIGQMARAMDDMGSNLNRMVVRIGHAGLELSGVSADVAEVSVLVEGAARAQAVSVAQVSAAVRQILDSSQLAVTSIDGLRGDADESSRHLGEMSRHIEETAENAQRLGDTADQVGKAIAAMTSSVAEVARRAEDLRQASSVTADSIAQLDAANCEVEQNAKGTLEIAEEVNRDAQLGRRSVEETIAGIEKIRRASHEAAEVIELLAEKTSRISKVLSVIGNLSDQIDLLALNAAIIAAQSGEHGRAFAVVAEEIKSLSHQTGFSTREIGQVIQAVQEETARAVTAIRSAEESIAQGEVLSRRSGHCLDKIVAGVGEATGQMQRIAAATLAQSGESRVIRETMNRVEEMVGQIASLTRAQDRESESIVSAARLMGVLSSQVRQATSQQSQSGKVVAGSAREIQETVQGIRQACDEQRIECEKIARAMEEVEGGAGKNLEHARRLQRSVSSLTLQVEFMQKEMGVFTLVREEQAEPPRLLAN